MNAVIDNKLISALLEILLLSSLKNTEAIFNKELMKKIGIEVESLSHQFGALRVRFVGVLQKDVYTMVFVFYNNAIDENITKEVIIEV